MRSVGSGNLIGRDLGDFTAGRSSAELAAAVLARLYGASNDGYSYDYLKRYADRSTGDVYRLCLSVLGEVAEVLEYILDLTAKDA